MEGVLLGRSHSVPWEGGREEREHAAGGLLQCWRYDWKIGIECQESDYVIPCLV